VVARRIWTSAIAAAAAAAGVGLAALAPGGQAQAFEQPVEQHVDLGGAACLHLAADLAIPEHAGDRTALALRQASATLGSCSE
jgi:hypothetical protein